MKKIILSILLFVIVGLMANSCQNDETPDNSISTSERLTNKSALTNLLMRVSQTTSTTKTTARDEDDSMCFVVNLPVTIIINGQSVTITDPINYTTVLDALENIDDDTISVDVVFPITITFTDGTTQIINDITELQTALDGCHSDDDDDDDIECLDIHYPLSITFYNAIGTPIMMTFNNNFELFEFLENLEDDDSFAISYPATITDANGATIVVQNNDQLESSIEDADEQCGDNDDD